MLALKSTLTALTIDDDEEVRRSIVAYLEDAGFTVLQASGGRQGIAMFDQHSPDLVFTDLMMPEVDGLAVVQSISRQNPDTPVVVISGNASVSYAIEAVRKGAWDYITKPILDFTVLDKITSQVLQRAESLRVDRAYQESLKRAVMSQEQRISAIESTDPLTGLPLRSHTHERFRQFLIRPDFTGDLFVMSLELDNLREINESYGHEWGGRFLVEAARRLETLVRDNVTIAHAGNEQFVVMVANDSDMLARVRDSFTVFESPITLIGQEVFVTMSMGVAAFPQDGESIESLLQHADIARAKAKISGKNCHRQYTSHLWDQVQDRIALESGLRKGLSRQEFLLYYQPKMDARTRRMSGMEALMRWRPTGSDRLVSPEQFVPVLEESGLIVEVGSWVLETACKQYVEWRKRGMAPVRLSVNISALQFASGNLPEVVRGVLTSTGMEPGCLCLELTENIVVKDIDETVTTLRALSGLGVMLSIDDFGTGYSSLSYLKDMPIDELKIDRSFIMNLPGDITSVALVETILDMSQRMKLTVVAEGVETSEQADFLCSRGCQELQGFLFSKPMPSEDFFGWCRGREYCDEHREQDLNCNWEPGPVEQLAGGIAHDFKNILTGISGNLELAQMTLDESHASVAAIRRAEKASLRANELAEKLMKLTKPVRILPKKAVVADIISECIELSLAGRDFGSIVQVEADLPDAAMDGGELAQVLTNLIINAMQAMSAGGSISVQASVAGPEQVRDPAPASGRYILLRVTDTGHGISPEDLGQIFDPYFTTKADGNGLGLVSARNIMARSKGSIAIDSRLGQGTTVQLVIPAVHEVRSAELNNTGKK